MNSVKYKYSIKPERTFQEAVGDAELLIINADFALEYPQPLLPGMELTVYSRTFQEAVGDAELLIINADFALEYPQPLLPGMELTVYSRHKLYNCF